MWFIGVEVEQETSAPPPKKNPGSAPGIPPALSCLPLVSQCYAPWCVARLNYDQVNGI